MTANFKLAPLSCHCKLNVLVHHLKKISAQKAMANGKDMPKNIILPGERLLQHCI